MDEKLRKAEQTIALLRSALVGLMGVDGAQELRQMEVAVRHLPAPESDRAVSINAIHALIATFPRQVEVAQTVKPLAIGDYVLATKYSDGDPGDAWALGFYAGELDMGNDSSHIKMEPRYMVKDGAGKNIRGNGYRRVERIRDDVGRWMLHVAAKQLEQSPPGTVNLWTMLTPAAFEDAQDYVPRQDAGCGETPPHEPDLLESLIYLRDCIETGAEPAMSSVNAAIEKATKG